MTERCIPKAAIIAAFLFLSSGWSAIAVASVDISPVRLDLSNDRNKDTIRFGNGGDETKSYQVDVVNWSQSEGKSDEYTPSDDLLVVPPIFTLEPGEQQVVRIGLMRSADPDTELTYRIFFTELAPAQPDSATTSGVTMRLRLGIPVFVAPNTDSAPNLELVGSQRDRDEMFMRFRNTGKVHVKVNEVQYEAPGLADKTVTPAVFYVLPGQTASLPVSLPHGNAVGKVTLITDTAGKLEYDLQSSP